MVFLSAVFLAGCGGSDSTAVAAANTAPVANAGPDQNIINGSVVALDGSGSTDSDGNALTLSWLIVTKPGGSTAALSNATTGEATFTSDLEGIYVVSLIANDGAADSAADTVTVTATGPADNSVPVANAGPDQDVNTGNVVTLDGSGSTDADPLDVLTYSWAITVRPAGSTAALLNATTVSPTFTYDAEDGAFVIQLIVNDGLDNSAPDTVTVR